MGCDIHGWVEVKTSQGWVAVKPLKDCSRNYRRFTNLAGVRDYDNCSNVKPLGIPNDVSITTRYDIDNWGIDGHSHSYLPLERAANIFLHSGEEPSDYEKKHPESAFFDYEEEDVQKARLVFWFDN